jgi:hypothetical protein
LQKILTFNLRFFLFTIALLVIEVLIALYVRDKFIRPYVGDFLVVILIYCAVKTFCKIAPLPLAAGVLLFSCVIETLQYFNIVSRLGLENNQVAKTIIGYGFEWWDILAYTLGVATVLLLEYIFDNNSAT